MTRPLRALPLVALLLAACGTSPSDSGLTLRGVSKTARANVAVTGDPGRVEIVFPGIGAYKVLATTDDIASVKLTLRAGGTSSPYIKVVDLDRKALVQETVKATFDGVPSGKARLEVAVFADDNTPIGNGTADASVKARQITRIPLNVKLLPGLTKGAAEAVITFENPEGEDVTPTTPAPTATPTRTPSPTPAPTATPTRTPTPTPTPKPSPSVYSPVVGTAPRVLIRGNTISVDLFTSSAAHSMGPRFWESITPGWGVVLYWPNAFETAVWTPDMKFALDVVFVRDGKVIDLVKNLQPCADRNNCRPYYPPGSVNWVLDLPANTIDRLGIKVGDEAQLLL